VKNSDDIITTNPVVAVGAILVVGAIAYAAISLVMRNTVQPLEVGLFAVTFAVVYVIFAYYADTIEGYLGTN
jgi:hypothetical protein